jgi:hypothetical protein
MTRPARPGREKRLAMLSRTSASLLRRQRLAQSTIGEAERMLPEHVLEARDHGATWHDITAALATSPNKPNSYSPDSPVADSRCSATTEPTANHAT